LAARRDIIVIGASAGGVEALCRLLAELPASLDAAVFIVMHTTPHGPSVLAHIFDRACPLKVTQAIDNEPIVPGRVYVAPPDLHMTLGRGRVRLARGPMENHTRPAIDPLFRSAALQCGTRVIGVILTGFLDDGAAGLVAVKARGGLAVVQDPDDAREPSMPRSALEHVEADHVVPLRGMGELLARLVGETVPQTAPHAAPETLEIETRIATAESTAGEQISVEKLGPPSPFSCPECHGVLYEVRNGQPMRFRCRVGHAYTAKSLITDQSTALEAALWMALRALEENAALALRMAERAKGGRTGDYLRGIVADRQRQAEEIRRGIAELRQPVGVDEPA
jgi:two-component system chemotaxis response regulator CheB